MLLEKTSVCDFLDVDEQPNPNGIFWPWTPLDAVLPSADKCSTHREISMCCGLSWHTEFRCFASSPGNRRLTLHQLNYHWQEKCFIPPQTEGRNKLIFDVWKLPDSTAVGQRLLQYWSRTDLLLRWDTRSMTCVCSESFLKKTPKCCSHPMDSAWVLLLLFLLLTSGSRVVFVLTETKFNSCT